MIGRKHFEIVQWLLIGQPIVVFENSKSQIIEGRESLELEDVLSMEASLMHLGLIRIFGDRFDNFVTITVTEI